MATTARPRKGTGKIDWQTILGVVILAPVLALLLASQFVPVHDPLRANLVKRLLPPAWEVGGSKEHLFGTDQLGRDVLSRLIVGGRTSLAVAGITIVLSTAIGVALGAGSGYARGTIDRVTSGLISLQLALPGIVLALGVVAALGSSTVNLVVVLTLATWVPFAKVVRDLVLSLREREFVMAARAIGASEIEILLRHLLPHVLSAIIVIASLRLGRVIVIEAALSYLGLGVPPPQPSWGNMLGDGRNYIRTAFWLSTLPGIAITTTVLGVTLIGQGLMKRWVEPHG